MPEEILEYNGNDLIKSDLRRLKHWKSLEDDIFNHYRMFLGKITDDLLKSVFCLPLCDHITTKEVDGVKIYFHKMRVKISSPKTSYSDGGRLVFGIIVEEKKFLPLFCYGAFEEKKFYIINGKKIRPTSSGLIKIINEKFK